MEPSIPGTKITSRSIGITGAPYGGIKIMIRGRCCCLLLIASRGPPILLGGTRRIDPDLSFLDGVSSIRNR
jgi:hypothetical protein